MSLISLGEVVKVMYGKCTAVVVVVVVVIMWGKVKNDDGGGEEKRMIFRVDRCGSDEYRWEIDASSFKSQNQFQFPKGLMITV